MSSLITTAKFRRLVHFLILIRVKFLKDLGAVHTWCVGTSGWVLPQNGGVSSQFEYPISDYVHPAGFLKTLSPNGSFASNNFFGQKLSKVANIKTKSATIAFFLFSSFPQEVKEYALASQGKSCRPENNNYSQSIYMSWPLSVKHAAKTTFAQ